jgi:hypothetical protein
MEKKYTNVSLKLGVGDKIQSASAFRTREKPDAAEKEDKKKKKTMVDEKTEAMVAM